MTQIALGGFLVGPLVIGYAADHLAFRVASCFCSRRLLELAYEPVLD